MPHDKSMIDRYVYAWYADPQRWRPQGKSEGWADRVLCDQGELFFAHDVLNLGCFYPEDEEAFAHLARTWTATDFVPEVIERCRQHQQWPAHVQFQVADMRELSYADSSFDVVTDFSSGDHLSLEDWMKAIREAYRVLRPGGHFLVCYASALANWSDSLERYGDYGYERAIFPSDQHELLTRAGFQVVRRSHDGAGQVRAGVLAQKPV